MRGEAIEEKVWSDEDIAVYEEQKNNKYLFNFLSDEAKAALVSLAMADKENIMANKIFAGAIEGRVAKQLKDICLLDQAYVKAEDVTAESFEPDTYYTMSMEYNEETTTQEEVYTLATDYSPSDIYYTKVEGILTIHTDFEYRYSCYEDEIDAAFTVDASVFDIESDDKTLGCKTYADNAKSLLTLLESVISSSPKNSK